MGAMHNLAREVTEYTSPQLCLPACLLRAA